MGAYDDGTKKYIMQRERNQDEKIVSYPMGVGCSNDDIRVFVLFSDKNQRYVDNMQKKLANKKLVLVKGLAETEMAYDEKIDIVNNFDYVVVVISRPFLEDLDLLDVLVANYEIGKKNKKILPIIIWKDLYEPEVKAQVLEDLRTRIVSYRESHFDNDFSGSAAEDLKKMQQILKMLKSFMKFATERDRKTKLQGNEKLLKYIHYDRGIDVANKENFVTKKEVVLNQTINVHSGGQINMASDNANINTTTNTKDELKRRIKKMK